MIFVMLLAAIAVHEEGHWVAARLLRYPARFVMTRRGPGTTWGDHTRTSPPRDRFLVSAAGPAANVIFAAEAYTIGWTTVAAVSLTVGLAQLLPIGPSDGRNMLKAFRT